MHEEYMRQALALAQEAAAHGEVPVGCVIVREGRIVGRGRNRREEKQHTSSHAEMEAIRQANEALGTWRLDDCTLYVTLEPCPMCAGAILNARIPRVYYGARDREMGACGGVLNLFMEDFPHPPALVGGGLPPGADGFLPTPAITHSISSERIVLSSTFVVMPNLSHLQPGFCLFRWYLFQNVYGTIRTSRTYAIQTGEPI